MLGLAGCASEEQMPQIVYDGPVPTITAAESDTHVPTFHSRHCQALLPRAWVPSRPERAWSAIIIHHSATDEGNAAIIDKWHREEMAGTASAMTLSSATAQTAATARSSRHTAGGASLPAHILAAHPATGPTRKASASASSAISTTPLPPPGKWIRLSDWFVSSSSDTAFPKAGFTATAQHPAGTAPTARAGDSQ